MPGSTLISDVAGASWQQEYPFAGDYLTVDGYRIHYVDTGTGRPLLMVHGNPTWSFYFRHLIDSFQSRRRCVAVDHLGCGLSDKPQDYAYDLQHHAANLERLIEQLDLRRITLVAHDWGGPIGLLAASRMQDRFEEFVLLNTACFPPPYIPWRIRICRIPWFGTLGVRGANLFARAAQFMAVERPERLTRVARSGLIAPYADWRSRVAIDRFVHDIPGHRNHASWPVLAELEQRLKQMQTVHVLLIWGMRDWCFRPDCLVRLQQVFPQHQTVELADVGHWVLEEAGERVAEEVERFSNA